MPDITMPTARNLNEDGSYELVQIPGTPYTPMHTYYSPDYHDNLVCRHCDAKVHFHKGGHARLGSAAGQAPHFRTNPGQKHENCLWPKQDSVKRERNVDLQEGYRIHINTRSYTQLFNRHAGVYGMDAKGRLFARDPALKTREAFSAGSVEKLLTLMKKGELERLHKSKVIFDNNAVDWHEFFLHLRRPERYAALVSRLRIGAMQGAGQAVLMEIKLDRAHIGDLFSDSSAFNAKRILIGTDRLGHGEYVVPGISIKHGGDTSFKDCFNRTGKYLVLGVPRLNRKQYGLATYNYINMTINSPRQVYFGNIEDIALEAKAKAAKREVKLQLVV